MPVPKRIRFAAGLGALGCRWSCVRRSGRRSYTRRILLVDQDRLVQEGLFARLPGDAGSKRAFARRRKRGQEVTSRSDAASPNR
ncbi:MAG: hypothetical protein KY432_02540, partial [Acidobacteria bacterium]|nr:hypothetical protein [Acidobacteriota bacterium]